MSSGFSAMAQRHAGKARSNSAPRRARPARDKIKGGTAKGDKAGLTLMARLAAVERERDDLRAELQRSQARVRQLEAGHAQVRDRIAWALDALHGILDGKA